MQRIAIPTRALVASLALAIALSASCDRGGSGAAAAGVDTPSASPSSQSPVIAPASPGASSTPAKRPDLPNHPPPTRGPGGDGCVDGWVTPAPADPLRGVPWRAIRAETGWHGSFVVVDMRYFTGPESPPTPDKGYLRVVQRWYVKGFVRGDPALAGRFLVERRRFGTGLSAVAPYDSEGWTSPDWIGFQLDTADLDPRTYPGLPGRWAGIPYDFVGGGEGIRFPGLPQQVIGCLDGT
jgi:hypothetical protein